MNEKKSTHRLTTLNTFFFCLFFLANGMGQTQKTFTIKGQVVDSEKQGLDLAIVALMTMKDSTIVQSEFTNPKGNYSFLGVEGGEYTLSIRLLGYQKHQEVIQIQSDENLSPIYLSQDAQLIDEVTITAKIPYIERLIDRTVINPDALISNAGNNGLEVLENAPGITFDNEGSILMKGRSGVAVYINDKPSYLSGNELENYLRSLPAGSIKKLELMPNPPAKYDAAGNGGVINIIIKRSTLIGLHGNMTAGYRQGKRKSSNNSLNLSLNKGDLSFYSNIYGGFYGSLSDLTINRFYQNEANEATSAFSQNSALDRSGKYLQGKAGVDYYLSDVTTTGLSYKHVSSPTENLTDNTALVTSPNGQLLQRVLADNEEEGKFEGRIYNAYIQHQIDTLGTKISMDADYVTYTTDRNQVFLNSLFDANGNETFADQINGQIPAQIKILAGKSDYSRPLGSSAKFEAGIKSAWTQTDNEAIYNTTIDQVTSPDYGLSNRFIYDEWINAAYTNYTRSFGKIDIQLGLRAETTRLTGDQKGNEEVAPQSFERTYNSLFPTFYVSWKVDSLSKNILNLNYGRRIDRPYFQDLNPFVSPLDRFTFYVGNPGLLPTYSHNLSLTHSWNNQVNTTLSYTKRLDGINETLEIRDEIYYSRPGNIATNDTWTLSMDAYIPVSSWYTINAYAEATHLAFKSQLYTEQLNSSGLFRMLSLTNNFVLGKGWKADCNLRTRSDMVYGQLLLKGFNEVNLGVQKTLFDGRGSIKLGISDLFYDRIGAGVINNLRLTEADWINIRDTRRVSLTFSYRFGKSNSKKPKYNSSGSDSEQQRVRG